VHRFLQEAFRSLGLPTISRRDAAVFEDSMDHQYDFGARLRVRLLWLLLTILFAARAHAQSSRADTLRIALFLHERQTNADGMLTAGVALGVSEATRAATLFGGGVRVVPGTLAATRSVSESLRALRLRGVSALIANTSCDTLSAAAEKAHLLFIDAGCTVGNDWPAHSLTFHLWPSETQLEAALAQAPTESRSAAHVVVWDSTLDRFGADQLNQRFRIASGRAMTSEAWSGWFAIKLLWEASLRVHSVDAELLARALLASTSRFDGHKGSALSFRASDHRLMQPLYVIIEQHGTRRVIDGS
jgi:hypothetical protein